MTMDGTFIDNLAAKLEKPSEHTIGGRQRLALPPGWTSITRDIPQGHPLVVSTLTGLLDYVTHEPPPTGSLVHVESATKVSVRGPVEADDVDFRRRTYLTASLEGVQQPFPFGSYLDYERFVIGLQTAFVAGPEIEELLVFSASVRESSVTEHIDDRVAQQVKVQQGVAFVGMKDVPNPVQLRPWRTFTEIDQPASKFILRVQSAKEGQRPTAALFEADGQHWKLDAIVAIAGFLREKNTGLKVIA